MRWILLGIFLGYPAFAVEASAENAAHFRHDSGRPGIVRPGDNEISPETDAPEHPADQMLQTEAPLPRKLPPAKKQNLQRAKSFEGRFHAGTAGTESRQVPTRNDETGMVWP